MPEFSAGAIRTELINALSRSSVLRYLGTHHPDMRDLRRLLEAAEVVTVEAGRTIIHEGHEPDRMYFIVSGVVRIEKAGKHIASLARVGDVFGEFGPLTGELRSATVVAATEVTCLATDRGFARRLAREENAALLLLMHRALDNILMERLTQASTRLADAEARIQTQEAELNALREEKAQRTEEATGASDQSGLNWPRRHQDRRPR